MRSTTPPHGPHPTPGRALMLIAAGHALWGLIAYREPLREIADAGLVGAVGDGIFQRTHADDRRAAAFWFMLAAPLVGLVGYLADRADDARARKVAGGTGIALGTLGVVVIPRSGFALVPPVGYWLIRETR